MSSQQAVVQVIYPNSAASSFNLDYYLNNHIPLVEKRWGPQGLQRWAVTVGEQGAGYYVQATLVWKNIEAFESAKFKHEVMDDIKNFTDVSPSRWVGTVIGQGIIAD